MKLSTNQCPLEKVASFTLYSGGVGWREGGEEWRLVNYGVDKMYSRMSVNLLIMLTYH